MANALRPFRGGWYTHLFGATWFIVEFLRGNSHYGSERIDPARGAHQAYIHGQYKLALRRALAEDQAARDQSAFIHDGKPPLSEAAMDLRTSYYFSHLPRRLHRMRYSSFTVYFSLLKRLGWVEPTGEQQPSEPQDYDENFKPRVYYRLTSQGLAETVPEVFDPVMLLYPHYTREKRSGKARRYFRVPGLPVGAPRARAPERPAPEGTRLMTQAEADQAFARQAAEQAEVEAEEAPTEEAKPAVDLTGQAKAVIASLQNIPDEEDKSKSLKKLEKALGEVSLEVREVVEGLDDVESAVEAYRDIKPKGMTPEDYQAEKESAWSDIESALEELEVLEE